MAEIDQKALVDQAWADQQQRFRMEQDDRSAGNSILREVLRTYTVQATIPNGTLALEAVHNAGLAKQILSERSAAGQPDKAPNVVIPAVIKTTP